MAITINKNLVSIPNVTGGTVIMSDNENVLEFSSSEETNRLDFKFKIDITVAPQGTGNTATALNYTTYRQYGYLGLYSIINSKKLYSKTDFSSAISGINPVTIDRSQLTLKITETWLETNGSRTINTSGAVTITAYIHNGIGEGVSFAPMKTIEFGINNTISTNLKSWFFPRLLNDNDLFFVQNGISVAANSVLDNVKKFPGITINQTTLGLDPFTVQNDVGRKIYKVGVSNCVENNFINWLNDSGYFEVFNFEHSHEEGSTSSGQDYYTSHKKTAIVSTQNTVTLSTRYLKDDIYNHVLNILQSPEVYWNGVPVTPIRKGVTTQQKRFEKLISLTLEFEISKKEKSVLR